MTASADGSGARRRPAILRRIGGLLGRAAILAGLVAGVAAAAAALQSRAAADAGPDLAAPLPVLTMPVRIVPGHVERRRFAGRIEPARRAALGFEQGGLIVQVLVQEGDRVAQGAPLARRDAVLAENRRVQLLAARDRQAAALELARLTEARQVALGAAATNPQRRDEARLARAQAEAGLAEIEAALAGVAIEIAKATLRAPFAGTVAARLLDEGAVAGAGAPVLDLIETAAPRARIGLSPEVAAGLAPGETHLLETPAGPRGARLIALRPDLDTASRTVTALFELDADPPGGHPPGAGATPPASQAGAAPGAMASPGGSAPPVPGAALRFGDIVTFEAEIPQPGPGFWLPLTALVDGGRGTWAVHALDESAADPVVRREAVQVLSVAGEEAFVTGPLAPGTRILRDGTNRVRPGQAVRLLLAQD